jgi:isopenicillin N synthase-like dioxygenase
MTAASNVLDRERALFRDRSFLPTLAAQAHGFFEISRFPVDAHLLPDRRARFFRQSRETKWSLIVLDFGFALAA